MAPLITTGLGEFLESLPRAGKLAGLDVGTKTIGLAICDSGWHFAGPAQTIRRTKFTKDLEQLRGFIGGEHVVSARGSVTFRSDQPSSVLTEAGLRTLLLKNDKYVPLR